MVPGVLRRRRGHARGRVSHGCARVAAASTRRRDAACSRAERWTLSRALDSGRRHPPRPNDGHAPSRCRPVRRRPHTGGAVADAGGPMEHPAGRTTWPPTSAAARLVRDGDGRDGAPTGGRGPPCRGAGLATGDGPAVDGVAATDHGDDQTGHVRVDAGEGAGSAIRPQKTREALDLPCALCRASASPTECWTPGQPGQGVCSLSGLFTQVSVTPKHKGRESTWCYSPASPVVESGGK